MKLDEQSPSLWWDGYMKIGYAMLAAALSPGVGYAIIRYLF